MESHENGKNDETLQSSFDYFTSQMFILVSTYESCLISIDDHQTLRYYAFNSFFQGKFVSLSKIQMKNKKIV